jgi:ABC-type transport system involved in multi-copper enzyme maturation permease subunit
MSTVLLSEYRKLTTTRGWIVLLVVTAGVVLLFSAIIAGVGVLGGSLDGATNMFKDPSYIGVLFTAGNQSARIVAVIAGAMAMGGEYRHKTLATSLLAVPSRPSMVIGKAIVTLGQGLLLGVVTSAISLAVAAVMVVIKHGSLFLDRASSWQALLMNALAVALWALIGFGFGILIKNMIASILLAVGFAYILEPVLNVIFVLKHWSIPANLMPSSATSSLVGIDTNGLLASGMGAATWPAYAGLLVLLGWGVIPAMAGLFTTVRQDVA